MDIFFSRQPSIYPHYIAHPVHGDPAPHSTRDVAASTFLEDISGIVSFEDGRALIGGERFKADLDSMPAGETGGEQKRLP